MFRACEKSDLRRRSTDEILYEIIKQVKTIYYIDLYDTDFINFFTVHLSNALFRCRHNVSIRTPLSDEIFIQNPLIYEIAVFIAQEIKTTFGSSF